MMSVLRTLVLIFIGFTLTTGSKNTEEIESRIRTEVKKWEQNFSGKPVNCVPGQWLFSGNALLETSNGTKITGVGKIFHHCKNFWEEAFQEMEIFTTSPLFFNGYSVSFSRTILILTHENCRLPWHGITTLTFNEEYKISKWQDFYDAQLLKTHRSQCDLSNLGIEEEESTKKPKEEL